MAKTKSSKNGAGSKPVLSRRDSKKKIKFSHVNPKPAPSHKNEDKSYTSAAIKSVKAGAKVGVVPGNVGIEYTSTQLILTIVDEFIYRNYIIAPHLRYSQIFSQGPSEPPVTPLLMRCAYFLAFVQYLMRCNGVIGAARKLNCPAAAAFPIPLGLAKLMQYHGRAVCPKDCAVRQKVYKAESLTVNTADPSIHATSASNIMNRVIHRRFNILCNYNTSQEKIFDYAKLDSDDSAYVDPNGGEIDILDYIGDITVEQIQALSAICPTVRVDEIPCFSPDFSAYAHYSIALTEGAVYCQFKDFDNEIGVMIGNYGNLDPTSLTGFLMDKSLPVVRGVNRSSNNNTFKLSLLQNYAWLTSTCRKFHPGTAHMLLKTCSVSNTIKSFSVRTYVVEPNWIAAGMLDFLDAAVKGNEGGINQSMLYVYQVVVWSAFMLKMCNTDSIPYIGVDGYETWGISNDVSYTNLPPALALQISSIGPTVVDGEVRIPILAATTPNNYLRGVDGATSMYKFTGAGGTFGNLIKRYDDVSVAITVDSTQLIFAGTSGKFVTCPVYMYNGFQLDTLLEARSDIETWSPIDFACLGNICTLILPQAGNVGVTLTSNAGETQGVKLNGYYQSTYYPLGKVSSMVQCSYVDAALAMNFPLLPRLTNEADNVPIQVVSRGSKVGRSQIEALLETGNATQAIEFGNRVARDLPAPKMQGHMLLAETRENTYLESAKQFFYQQMTTAAGALTSGGREAVGSAVTGVANAITDLNRSYFHSLGKEAVKHIVGHPVSYTIANYAGRAMLTKMPGFRLQDSYTNMRMLK